MVYVIDPDNLNLQPGFADLVIPEEMIVAGVIGGGIDSCTNDSGTSLILMEMKGGNLRFGIIGVTSFGVNCALKGLPGVYARTDIDNTAFQDFLLRARGLASVILDLGILTGNEGIPVDINGDCKVTFADVIDCLRKLGKKKDVTLTVPYK